MRTIIILLVLLLYISQFLLLYTHIVYKLVIMECLYIVCLHRYTSTCIHMNLTYRMYTLLIHLSSHYRYLCYVMLVIVIILSGCFYRKPIIIIIYTYILIHYLYIHSYTVYNFIQVRAKIKWVTAACPYPPKINTRPLLLLLFS